MRVSINTEDNTVYVEGRPLGVSCASLDEKIARLDKAVRELIEEAKLPANHQEWLETAARRAGVDLNEVLPRTH